MGKNYALFLSPAHSELRFEFPRTLITKFKVLWAAGNSMNTICEELAIEYTEFLLIALDLNYLDELTTRKNGIFAGMF